MDDYKRPGHSALPTVQVVKRLWQIHLLHLGLNILKKKSYYWKLKSKILSESMPIKIGEN